MIRTTSRIPFPEILGWDGYFTEELCCHGSADLHGLGSSSCWELMGLDARSGFTNCCSPGTARRSQQCWGTNPMLTEARCCGDDLVDEDPANLPHDAVRRFDTAISALKLERLVFLLACFWFKQTLKLCCYFMLFLCSFLRCMRSWGFLHQLRNIHNYLHSHQVRSNPGAPVLQCEGLGGY